MLARFLERHAPVLALTGAGVSTASGLPDFRSPGGLWERLDPMVDGHVDMLTRDPGARLAVLGRAARRGARSSRTPRTTRSRGSRRAASSSGVVTQNIDGLHHAAGSDAVEVHGHLRSASCLRCGAEEDMASALARYAETRAGAGVPRLRRDTATAGRALRRAAACFGLGSRRTARRRTRAAACASGTSLQVYPAAGLAEAFVHARRPLAIVSQQPTELWEHADPRLLRAAEELLPAVVRLLVP